MAIFGGSSVMPEEDSESTELVVAARLKALGYVGQTSPPNGVPEDEEDLDLEPAPLTLG